MTQPNLQTVHKSQKSNKLNMQNMTLTERNIAKNQ